MCLKFFLVLGSKLWVLGSRFWKTAVPATCHCEARGISSKGTEALRFWVLGFGKLQYRLLVIPRHEDTSDSELAWQSVLKVLRL